MNCLRETAIVLISFFLASEGLAQAAPEGNMAAPLTTIQVQSRIVVIDVAVTDKQGNPVHGLKATDFVLLEAGKPQTVKHIEEQRDDVVLTWPNAKPPALPPHVFTNEVYNQDTGPLNILLLDKLNTPFEAQAVLLDQMKTFIKSMNPGTPIAIFGLNEKLILLQGFTSDPALLQAAFQRKGGSGSPPHDRPDDKQAAMKLSDSTDPEDPTFFAVRDFEAKTTTEQKKMRVWKTMRALNQLGRYLSGLSGRKNLIWFSGSFPSYIAPATNASIPGNTEGLADPLSSTMNVEDDVQETIGLLSRAQVAVYPVDPRGVATDPTYTGEQRSIGIKNRPDYYSNLSSQFAVQTTSEHMTMSQIASETGGKAFFNTNDLTGAVRKAINSGSNYYTLTYVPTKNDWHGEYRKISIKLAAKSGHRQLSFRTGYYATKNGTHGSFDPGPKKSANGRPSLVLASLERGAPAPTEIYFKVRLVPGQADAQKHAIGSHGALKPWSRYILDYAIDISKMKFDLIKDMHKGLIEVACIVYDQDGKVLNTGFVSANLSMDSAQFESAMKNGLQLHQEIGAPVNESSFFRLAVHDRMSDKVGAVEVQSALLKDSPPSPASR